MKDPKQALTQGEHDQVKTLLLAKGLRGDEVAAVIGAGPASRSRRELEQALTAWLKDRPKA